MMRYFKDSGDGFYSLLEGVPPSEGWVEITEAEWLAANPQSQPDPAGIIEAKKQAVRAMREQVLDRLSGIAGRAQRKGDTDLAAACDTASEALLDITKDLPSEPQAAELEMLSRYQVIAYIAIQAAPSLELAFAQVDA